MDGRAAENAGFDKQGEEMEMGGENQMGEE